MNFIGKNIKREIIIRRGGWFRNSCCASIRSGFFSICCCCNPLLRGIALDANGVVAVFTDEIFPLEIM